MRFKIRVMDDSFGANIEIPEAEALLSVMVPMEAFDKWDGRGGIGLGWESWKEPGKIGKEERHHVRMFLCTRSP